MRNKHTYVLPLAAVILTLAALPAAAEGFYVGAGFGQTKNNRGLFDSQLVKETGGSGSSVKETGTGYKLLVGYQFTPSVALEGGYVDLGKSTLTINNPTKVGQQSAMDLDNTVKGTTLDVVGTLPLAHGFTLLGKLGLFNWTSKTKYEGESVMDGSDKDLKYGFGMEYALVKGIALCAEYEQYNLDLDKSYVYKVGFLNVGVNYRF